MPFNDVYMLSVKGVVCNTQHIHTLHFQGVGPTATPALLIADWQANAMTAYRALFRNDEDPTQIVRADNVCNPVALEGPAEAVPAGALQKGTRIPSGSIESAFVAAVVAEKGTLAGRRRSGRFFLGGITQPDVLENNLAPAYLTLVQAYITALTTRYVGASPPAAFRLCTYSRRQLEVDPAASCTELATPVAVLVASDKVTTMRSRKLGHGL